MAEKDPANFDDIGNAADSEANAQWWLLFAVMVANKPAEITKRKLDELLGGKRAEKMPFHEIEHMDAVGKLRQELERVRAGQYTRIYKTFSHIVRAVSLNTLPDDPRTWRLEALDHIPGIGPKTARWFYLLCHPEAKVAALDTHVLKFLRDQGNKVPKGTPPAGRRYNLLECEFVMYAERLDMKPRDLDWFVWTTYRNGGRILLED